MRLLGEVFEDKGHRAQRSCSPQHTPGLVPFWEAATSMTRRAGALAAKGRPKGARLRLAGCLSRAARGALTVQAVLATPLAMLLVHSDLEGRQVQLGIPVILLLPTRAQHACWAARPGACFRARLQQQATSTGRCSTLSAPLAVHALPAVERASAHPGAAAQPRASWRQQLLAPCSRRRPPLGQVRPGASHRSCMCTKAWRQKAECWCAARLPVYWRRGG